MVRSVEAATSGAARRCSDTLPAFQAALIALPDRRGKVVRHRSVIVVSLAMWRSGSFSPTTTT
jgi:hypothetical protein